MTAEGAVGVNKVGSVVVRNAVSEVSGSGNGVIVNKEAISGSAVVRNAVATIAGDGVSPLRGGRVKNTVVGVVVVGGGAVGGSVAMTAGDTVGVRVVTTAGGSVN